MTHYSSLRSANIARQTEWDEGNQISLSFRGNELAGEVGEACNVIKKLDREQMGIKGSRDTVEHLAQELADVVICADLIASAAGINLEDAIRDKFNATSEKHGFKTRMVSVALSRPECGSKWVEAPTVTSTMLSPAAPINPVCDLQALLEIRDFLQDIVGGAEISERSRDVATGFVSIMDNQFGAAWGSEMTSTDSRCGFCDGPLPCLTHSQFPRGGS